MKNYYPTLYLGCNPLHAVKNWAKVRKLIRDARAGHAIPPMVIDGDKGNGSMITGTHRAAANDIMLMLADRYDIDAESLPLIPYIALDDMDISDDLQSALDEGDMELINDLLDK